MELKTTLKALRKNGACFCGYNKLVRSIQGRLFSEEDESRETYIRHRHDYEIALTYILESNGIDDALWSLRASNCSERDARLFAVWCARQVQHLMKDKRIINAIDVAERYANGEASDADLKAAWAAAWAAACAAACAAAREAAWAAALGAAREAARAAGDSEREKQKQMLIKMCNGEAPWQIV